LSSSHFDCSVKESNFVFNNCLKFASRRFCFRASSFKRSFSLSTAFSIKLLNVNLIFPASKAAARLSVEIISANFSNVESISIV